MNYRYILFSIIISISAVFPSDNGKGILFNFKQKILLAEKFINVRFLAPFPVYDQVIEKHLENITASLEKLWEFKNYGCNLNYTDTRDDKLRTTWLIKGVEQEHTAAKRDIAQLKVEIMDLLNLDKQEAEREKRALPLIAAGIAATGLFGAGLGFGGSASCLLKGIFGTCNKLSKKNKEKIEASLKLTHDLQDQWREVQLLNDDKFFIVSSELQDIKKLQKDIVNTQQANWEELTVALAIIQNNTSLMMHCTQYLYVRTQSNHLRSALLSNLVFLHTNIKAYRTALFTYRINLLNSLTPMSNNHLPMSLVPKSSLLEILKQIALSQIDSVDRLTLAILPRNVLTYYETKLLREVTANELGLMFTFSIPMSSSETVLDVFEAIPIPMPNTDSPTATVWDVEAEYLAITRTKQESAALTQKQLSQCIGSTSLSICHQGFPLVSTKESCLALLLFGNMKTAFAKCRVKIVPLPMRETAQNLGMGRWLLLSATENYALQESRAGDSSPDSMKLHQGCKSCIISLACGSELTGDFIHLRSDLSACSELGAHRLDIKLSDPLQHLFSLLPPLDELPNHPSLDIAREQLVGEVQLKLARVTLDGSPDQLNKVAEPILKRYKALRPHLETKFKSLMDWKASLILGITSFFLSTFLHLTTTYLYQKFRKVHTSFPFTAVFGGRKVSTRPVVLVTADDYIFLSANPNHPILKHSCVLPMDTPTTDGEIATGRLATSMGDTMAPHSFFQLRAMINTDVTPSAP